VLRAPSQGLDGTGVRLSQASTTPLASGHINHDRLTVELVEPDGMPVMVRIIWPLNPPSSIPGVSLTQRPRSPNCSPGRTSCSQP
jgi:hypothetical protein